jgi:hypothetical protein
MTEPALPSSRVCFAPPRAMPRGSWDVQIPLSDAHASAAAELFQVLACGEESAELAFDHLAESCQTHSCRVALARIAADELEHQMLLSSLRRCLPPPSPDAALHGAMRRFFMRLADRNVLVHCVRIVAIDSAVCHLLGALRRRGNPLASQTGIDSILARIHRDEARHVAIAKRCASPLLETIRGRDIVAEARDRLIQVLEFRAAAFDTLRIDPDRLFARLRGALPMGAAA